MKSANGSKSTVYQRKLKNFPISILKILPATLLMGLGIGILTGCQTSTASVEASTTRIPVVAPAGTVLRVRLNQTLETGRSRPGDRFSGTLDAPVIVGNLEFLPKGTKVEGHIEPGRNPETVLSIALDCFERNGNWYALSTEVVSRTGSRQRGQMQLQDVLAETKDGGAVSVVSVPANSIIGFTLKSTLTV